MLMSMEIPPFLKIPTEIRLLIYSYALHDTPAITIGTAELVGSHPDVVHRLYGNQRTPFPGIPSNHEPVIEPSYNSSLLSLTDPAIIRLPPAIPCPLEEDEVYSGLQYSPHQSLRLVNKQINDELTSHFNIAKNRKTSLFVAYPHGLHVLKTLTPGLIRQARSIHLAGIYTSKSFCAARAACLSSTYVPPHRAPPDLPLVVKKKVAYNGSIIPDAAQCLGSLIAALFGPDPKYEIRKLELRIYYPGQDSYSTVWGDDNSPTVIALRNIYAGEISIEVWRGQKGTGVYLSATKPMLESLEGEGRKKRMVSTVWRRLEEGRRGEARCGSWVVDPKWPAWLEESDVSDGPKGDCIVTTGV